MIRAGHCRGVEFTFVMGAACCNFQYLFFFKKVKYDTEEERRLTAEELGNIRILCGGKYLAKQFIMNNINRNLRRKYGIKQGILRVYFRAARL